MVDKGGKLRIAFQGEAGAFSEEAARGAFGADVATLPRRTFDEMFDAVASGDADLAMAPIENTLMGSIIKNYDLLVERRLQIVAEVILRIVHNLCALPGVTVPELRRVYSHPVALAQCERFLKANPQLEVVPEYDTAGSVKMIMEAGNREHAAIAGAEAARVYGAHILAAGIESNKQNFTRFLVLADPGRALALPIPAGAGPCKTSVVFGLANRPGCLYDALAAFAAERIDLTKIESRPIEGRPWEYSFYLDFLGAIDDPPIRRALATLQPMADFVRVLGSYPAVKAG